MKKIIALTQGDSIPSTRFRIAQYAYKWTQSGYLFQQLNAKNSAYPPLGLFKRVVWLISELVHRLRQLKQINGADLVVVQRELISTLRTVEPFIKTPIIFDVDDAIFMYRGGRAAKALALQATHIVCGNQYLADYFSRYNKNVTIIPTAVDVARFKPLERKPENLFFGWSGSSSGFDYLYEIETELKKTLDSNIQWKLLIVSDRKPDFRHLSADQWTFRLWSPSNEVETIQEMSIGLMPLIDNDWTKGKCSYKMLLYMACAVPVLVSDIGMNSEILLKAKVGLGVKQKSDWHELLTRMIGDENFRNSCGLSGRKVAESEYSLESCNDKWLKVFSKVIGQNSN